MESKQTVKVAKIEAKLETILSNAQTLRDIEGATKGDNKHEKKDDNSEIKMSLLQSIIKDTEEAQRASKELANEMPKEQQKDKTSKSNWSLPKFPSFRSSKKIYVYVPVPTKSTDSFHHQFSNEMKKMNVELEIIQDVSSGICNPLLVVCPVSSRLQPDVDHALQGIRRPVNCAVIVLYFGREGSEPKLLASTRLSEIDKFKNIELIDMAYDPDATIYNCPMNATAFEKIKTFVANI